MAISFMGFYRVFKVDDFHRLSLMELAEGSSKWIPLDGLNLGYLGGRSKKDLEAIAKEVEAAGGGNAIVVSMA